MNCGIVAFGARHVLAAADTGRYVVGRVQDVASGEIRVTAIAGPVRGEPAPLERPVVTGFLRVDGVLTWTEGTWLPAADTTTSAVELARTDGTWERVQEGAQRTYTVRREDLGRTLRVVVAGVNAIGSSTAAGADAVVAPGVVAPGIPTPYRDPVLAGEPIIGTTLTGDTGDWRWRGGTLETVEGRFYACDDAAATTACRPLADPGVKLAVPAAATGRYVRFASRARNVAGWSALAWTAAIGPVRLSRIAVGPTAGSCSVPGVDCDGEGVGFTRLRSTTRITLTDGTVLRLEARLSGAAPTTVGARVTIRGALVVERRGTRVVEYLSERRLVAPITARLRNVHWPAAGAKGEATGSPDGFAASLPARHSGTIIVAYPGDGIVPPLRIRVRRIVVHPRLHIKATAERYREPGLGQRLRRIAVDGRLSPGTPIGGPMRLVLQLRVPGRTGWTTLCDSLPSTIVRGGRVALSCPIARVPTNVLVRVAYRPQPLRSAPYDAFASEAVRPTVRR